MPRAVVSSYGKMSSVIDADAFIGFNVDCQTIGEEIGTVILVSNADTAVKFW